MDREPENHTTAVTRLVTFADLDNDADDKNFSVSARHEAELSDGTRVLLLNDRGWAESPGWPPPSIEHVQEITRMVVGPDEPFDRLSEDDMATDHWNSLQQTLQRQGVFVDTIMLRELPHDILLSQRLLARIRANPETGRHSR